MKFLDMYSPVQDRCISNVNLVRIITTGILCYCLSFANSSHVDSDELTDEHADSYNTELKKHQQDNSRHRPAKGQLRIPPESVSYMSRWVENFGGFDAPTSCGYSVSGRVPDGIHLFQFFVFEGLRTSVRIETGNVHAFFAKRMSHNTAVVVAVTREGRVLLSHPDFAIFSWGSGKTDSSKKKSKRKR